MAENLQLTESYRVSTNWNVEFEIPDRTRKFIRYLAHFSSRKRAIRSIIDDRYAFVSARLTLDGRGTLDSISRALVEIANQSRAIGENNSLSLFPRLLNYSHLSIPSNYRLNQRMVKLNRHEIIVHWKNRYFKKISGKYKEERGIYVYHIEASFLSAEKSGKKVQQN